MRGKPLTTAQWLRVRAAVDAARAIGYPSSRAVAKAMERKSNYLNKQENAVRRMYLKELGIDKRT